MQRDLVLLSRKIVSVSDHIMKDQIPNLTIICKQIAAIRGVYESRGHSGSTADELRRLEQEVADMRELFDWE